MSLQSNFKLLDDAVAANMNNSASCLGRWCYEEVDLFYDLCDEKGIIWQDLYFACAIDKDFLENVKAKLLIL
jgi:beta-galactosidase/beta-glucuronidase